MVILFEYEEKVPYLKYDNRDGYNVRQFMINNKYYGVKGTQMSIKMISIEEDENKWLINGVIKIPMILSFLEEPMEPYSEDEINSFQRNCNYKYEEVERWRTISKNNLMCYVSMNSELYDANDIIRIEDDRIEDDVNDKNEDEDEDEDEYYF